MGLDCIFQKTAESPEELVYPSGLRFCGGLFSGNGSTGSFRGKVYDAPFQDITEMTLYDDLSPEQISLAAEKLSAWVAAQSYKNGDRITTVRTHYDIRFYEMRDLAKLFQAAAEQKLSLFAWY